MMKRFVFAITILVIALAVTMWKKSTPPVRISAPVPEASSVGTAAPTPTAEVAVATSTALAAPAPVAPVVAMSADELGAFKPQMEEYALLKKKVLKSEDEKLQWASLLKNPHAVYRARKLLLAPTKEPTDLQDQALDFLVNAAKNGDPNAHTALESVIADTTIEGSNVDRSTQQFKAELKAVAMYELSSFYPEQEAHIAQLLPGPVSQKIWKNVLAQQANNVQESSLEISN